MQTVDVNSPKGRILGSGLALLVVLLAGLSAYAMAGLGRERRHAEELTQSNKSLTSAVQQLRSELQSTADKLNSLAAAATSASSSQPPNAVPPPRPRPVAPHATARTPATDKRWQEMQSRLADQQKEIANQREELDKAREDLEGKLNSTRDGLEGSIARTHEELASLEKRGQRNYFEFSLDKSKQFHQVGPLSLSVRSVNFKHKYYDMVMVVDDRQLEKKHVDLYEPVLLTLADRPQPVEIVVNEIGNNDVKGYVSAPKFKSSELASATDATSDAKGLQRR